MKALLIVYSYHHRNTEKIARVFANVLDAPSRAPQQVCTGELHAYDLIGFGSGIYGGQHHSTLLNLADQLPLALNRNAFLFSTSAMMGEDKVAKDHAPLREKLQSKGYVIVDEFQCLGFNTNSFLRLFGGMNKGRPNADDLKRAEGFAQTLKQRLQKT